MACQAGAAGTAAVERDQGGYAMPEEMPPTQKVDEPKPTQGDLF
jgi:hypothetical protein